MMGIKHQRLLPLGSGLLYIPETRIHGAKIKMVFCRRIRAGYGVLKSPSRLMELIESKIDDAQIVGGFRKLRTQLERFFVLSDTTAKISEAHFFNAMTMVKIRPSD